MTTPTLRLSLRQRAVLEALREHGSMSAFSLAVRCGGMTREAATGALQALYARVLVGRQPSLLDPQAAAVWSIEDAGVRALEVGE